MKISDRGVPANGAAISGQIIAPLSSAAAALRSVLYGSGAAPGGIANTSLPISLSALSLAFTEIAQAQKLLQNGNIRAPEVASVVAEYQHLLREFKSNLPRFQGWLLAERARLARRSSHSAAVVSWAETNQQTRKPNRPGHAKR